jgi:hypothetical protein
MFTFEQTQLSTKAKISVLGVCSVLSRPKREVGAKDARPDREPFSDRKLRSPTCKIALKGGPKQRARSPHQSK